MKKSLYDTNIIFILSIVLTIAVGIFNNANALFHEQEFNNEQISVASKEFIINLFDSVNSLSNEYIGNLEKIISLAKEYDIQEEYKPVLNNYINSLNNEIESHIHYKNYILTGNNTENKLAEDLLSNALNFESEAIKEFKKLE